MLIQLNDDAQEFLVAYINRFDNKMEAKYNSYEGESALQLFGLFHHFDVIFMIVHSF